LLDPPKAERISKDEVIYEEPRECGRVCFYDTLEVLEKIMLLDELTIEFFN
jgi:hypothetical protein